MVFSIIVSGQNYQADQKIIDSFLNKICTSTDSTGKLLEYLDLHNSYLREKKSEVLFLELFHLYCNEIKVVMGNNPRYKIISHKDNEECTLIKEYNLKTNDYTGVYYIVSNDKIISLIIIKNQKIISFCCSLDLIWMDNKKIKWPWLINVPDSAFNSISSKLKN